MSSKLNLKAAAGGSVSLVVDDTLTTDEEFNVSDGGIESGSNADGEWIKFPDGTLICTGRNVRTISTPNAQGAVFSSNWLSIDFPYTFIGPAFVSISHDVVGGRTWDSMAGGDSFFYGYILGVSSTSSSNISFMAIGRWK